MQYSLQYKLDSVKDYFQLTLIFFSSEISPAFRVSNLQREISNKIRQRDSRLSLTVKSEATEEYQDAA
jgi:fatty acid-binding protein DegV